MGAGGILDLTIRGRVHHCLTEALELAVPTEGGQKTPLLPGAVLAGVVGLAHRAVFPPRWRGPFQGADEASPMTIGQCCDIGRKKADNQDIVLVSPPHSLYAVIDGMGGMNAGYLAAHLAEEKLRATLDQEGDLVGRLGDLLSAISQSIYALGLRGRNTLGMGAAIVAVVLRGDRAHLYHAGDCRAYLLRRETLVRWTQDHDETVLHPILGQGRALNRYLGQADLEVEIQVHPVEPGDRILLCSDGVNKELDDAEIQALLAHGEPQAVADAILEAALAKGGRDNISALVLDP